MARPDPHTPPRPRRGLASGAALPIAVVLAGAVAGVSIMWRPAATSIPEQTGGGNDVARGATAGSSLFPVDTIVSADGPGAPSGDAPGLKPGPTPRPTGKTHVANPSAAPTFGSTFDPTAAPTFGPTFGPTPDPTPKPTPKPTPTPTPKPTPTPPPPSGVHLALGAWAGQPWSVSSITSFIDKVGGTPGLFLTYLSWPDRAQYVVWDEQQIANLGADHVMTWDPFGMTLKSIWNGDHDAYIRQYAQGAAKWGKRFYIRLMHEMNGDWYPWGRGVNGNTATDFVKAWRHVVDIFNQEGATNVRWIWSPNVRYGSLLPFADLYPGSSYVDWVALDGYNWGLDPHLGNPSWQSFGQIFGSSYNQITALAPGKPVMIAETASTENGGNKASWIQKTFMTDVLDYPAVRSIVWFNQADGPSDFRVNSSTASLNAFRAVVASSLWSGGLP